MCKAQTVFSVLDPSFANIGDEMRSQDQNSTQWEKKKRHQE
jgi:hypothetical protein